MLDKASGADRLTELRVRAAKVSAKIVWDLGMQQPPTEASFVEEFGPDGHIRYWEAELSGSIDINHFIDIVAKTGAISLDDLAKRRNYLTRALFDAYQMDERWFKGGVEQLAGARYPREFDKVQGVRLQGRAAADWLMQHPRWRELVPATLADFLSPTITSEPAADRDRAEPERQATWTSLEVTQWFKARVKTLSDEKPWYSEPEDLAAANQKFAGVTRELIRSLRAEFVAAHRRGRGPRRNSANPPNKSARQK